MKRLLIFAVFLSGCLPVLPTGTPTVTPTVVYAPTGTETSVLTQILSQTPITPFTATSTRTSTVTLTITDTVTFTPTPKPTKKPTKIPYSTPTPTSTPTQVVLANGISAQYFMVNVYIQQVNQPIFFKFQFTNETDHVIQVGVMGVRAIGNNGAIFTQPSWSRFNFGPHEVIDWEDNFSIPLVGKYKVKTGICLVENQDLWSECLTGGNWTYYLQTERIDIR